MVVKELVKDEVPRIYKHIENDFPVDERKPLAMMLAAMDAGNYKGFGLVSSNEILGYAFFFRLGDYYLLDYLAIVDGHRDKGLGSSFLNKLCTMFDEDVTIVGELENEAFAESNEAKTLQISRTDFYLKNGFVDTGARSFLYGVHYKIIEFSKKSHSVQDIEQIYMDIYKSMLPEKLFVKNVKIEASKKRSNVSREKRMNLKELLSYEKITIQCHDNPDADAIASGYGLYTFLKANGKNPRFIYSGKMAISKGNLVLMVSELNIPIDYQRDNTEKLDGLLITVDCQYGALNVTKFQADEVIIIDHHQQEIDNVEKTYIYDNMGSCSTVIWKFLLEAGFELENYPEIQTALYYGLYTDTLQFTGLTNPVDKDMKEELNPDMALINRLQNSNISARELEIAGVAMIRTIYNDELRFAVVKSEPCDPNILGLISDMVLQVSEIDYCIVFTVFDYGIKFSVRSCIKEAKANHIAAYVSSGVGSGGGHLYKAGGFIGHKEFIAAYGEYDPVTYFTNKLKDYRTGYEIIDTRNYTFDTEGSKKYSKKRLRVGYVKAADFLPVGEEITVRTLEGDLHVPVTEDTYIMIGIKGEIYPIKEAKFNAGYEKSDEPYDLVLEYSPKAKVNTSGASYDILSYAKSCYTTGSAHIYAKPLVKGAKIFTEWDRECYMLGEPEDFIACRQDDLSDVYIVEKNIFYMTYEEDNE